jgi:hypothetical protein
MFMMEVSLEKKNMVAISKKVASKYYRLTFKELGFVRKQKFLQKVEIHWCNKYGRCYCFNRF